MTGGCIAARLLGIERADTEVNQSRPKYKFSFFYSRYFRLIAVAPIRLARSTMPSPGVPASTPITPSVEEFITDSVVSFSWDSLVVQWKGAMV